ncbi:D-alanyl-D-alanine carboxypeptidase family protein [Acetobacterium bakii]|uniref:D-alanyl-D-alanine carboxypeptidase family protein n=1 Tax=Acetobacterium bakii TaxID=52689 RepID=UPI00067FF4E4|nr:D-alanyl-D-alanine carboxypeptidase family protein [Acetobacterium bakii]
MIRKRSWKKLLAGVLVMCLVAITMSPITDAKAEEEVAKEAAEVAGIDVTAEESSESEAKTELNAAETVASTAVGCSYRTHVQDIGWQNFVKDGAISGTEGQSLRLEGIEIKLDNAESDLGIEYQTQVQNIGWQGFKSGGSMSGTSGESLRLEAIQIRLTGASAGKYDIYYQVHSQNFGWLDWASNGKSAGTEGLSLKLEAIKIMILPKGTPAPGSTDQSFLTGNIHCTYRTHVQNIGWQDWQGDGQLSGTTGKGLNLEGIEIKLNDSGYAVGIEYQTHIQNIGWQDWKNNGVLSGTTGEALRLEAIKIRLTGADAKMCDLYYQVHAQNFGWLDWAQADESAGTEGLSYRLEGIKIMILPKGSPAPGATNLPFLTGNIRSTYRTHIQNIGWQGWQENGQLSGTVGNNLRLEGIEIKLNDSDYDVGIEYQTHIQNIGWQDWKSEGETSGTEERGLQLEAIRMQLTGSDAKMCDLYYLVSVGNLGWLNWSKNGELAGTEGMSLKLEAIRILILPKGSPAPGPTEQPLGSITRLVNKNHSIPSNYVPSDLVWVNLPSTRSTQLRSVAAQGLAQLFQAASANGLNLYCCSGYRSYETQAGLYQWNVDTYGVQGAELVSARPGMSEHQLGLAMDVTSASVGYDLLESFGSTAEGRFIKENAHKYGFIVRYAEGKTNITGYAYEPWHLRYLGVDAATAIYNSGKTMEEFYGIY